MNSIIAALFVFSLKYEEYFWAADHFKDQMDILAHLSHVLQFWKILKAQIDGAAYWHPMQ